MMFTSRRLDGESAASLGLVDVCVADDDLEPQVDALSREIVSNSWGTNRRVKRLLADSARLGRTEALHRERQLPYGLPEDRAERLSRPVGGRSR
jgi:enoyl-CoA hydratase/carnithine racemase